MVSVWTYQLRDRFTNEIRYVGKTDNPVRRLKQHCRPSKNLHKWRWVKEHIAKGDIPAMELLNEWPDGNQANADEMRLIAEYRTLNYPLTNLTDGGDGARGINLSPERRVKVGDVNKGRKHTEEARRHMKEASEREKLKPGYYERKHEAMKLAWARHRARFMRAAELRRNNTDVERKRLAALSLKHGDPEYQARRLDALRHKLLGVPRTVDVKRRVSISLRESRLYAEKMVELRRDSAWEAKRVEGLRNFYNSDSGRALQSELSKRRWAKVRNGEKPSHSDEQRAKLSVAQSALWADPAYRAKWSAAKKAAVERKRQERLGAPQQLSLF